MTLRNPNAKDILPRLEKLAQDQTRRNIEYAIDKKHVVQVAKELEATRKEIALSVERTRETIAIAIKDVVNGKIDRLSTKIDEHNAKHEQDMVRIMPALESFEEWQRDKEVAAKSGKIVLWLAAFVTAVGSAWLIIRQIFFS